MYWLFNADNLGFKGERKETLKWEQSRNFKGNIGDKIIFFTYKNGKRYFTHIYNIEFVKTEDNKDSKIKSIQVDLSLENKYEEDKDFTDYLYSIPRIKYFDKYLYRHFNRKYYRLSKTEFNAIDKDEIFQSRTILGSVLNAIHIEHRKAFAIYLVEQYPEVIQNNYNYSKVLELFYEYLDFAIIRPSKQLREAYSDISEIVEPEIIAEIGFADEEHTLNVELIQMQANAIVLNLESFQTAISFAREDQPGFKDEAFQNLFRNRPLPIDFNL